MVNDDMHALPDGGVLDASSESPKIACAQIRKQDTDLETTPICQKIPELDLKHLNPQPPRERCQRLSKSAQKVSQHKVPQKLFINN